jgi:hypothetical protein
MPYSSIIPGVNDRISISQDDILNNFQEIKNLIDVNHITFDDPSGDQGKHKFVSIPSRDDSPPTISKEVGIYSAPGAFSRQTELYVKKQSNATPYSITEQTKVPNEPEFSWLRLPSGILLKWGFVVVFGYETGIPQWNAAGVVFKSNNIPEFTNVFSIILSGAVNPPERVNANYYVVSNSITTNGFTFLIENVYTFVPIKTHFVNYLAIGI